MDIHLLVINVGNTRVALGTFVAGELQTVSRVPLANRADLPAAIAAAWARIADADGAAVAGSSVNPPITQVVSDAVLTATKLPVQWVGQGLDVPIRNLTANPQQTGVDRLLNLAAAYEQMQKACVVVDAGTAMTVDVCNDAGEFMGGAITAGAGTILRALHEMTAQLPAVSLVPAAAAIGQTTESAMISGVYHGLRGAVKELVEQYALQLGRWPEIIATGGDARTLFDGWELIHAVSPDLTLYGIALAYAEHHIRHGG